MSIYKPGRPAKYDPHKNEDNKPPSKPGEYTIRNRSGNVRYVGETNDLRRRADEHTRDGNISRGETYNYKIADGRSTSSTRRDHERGKIHQHDPPRNKTKGGEGRRAEK